MSLGAQSVCLRKKVHTNFGPTVLTHEKLRNSNRPCTKHHSFHTKCCLQMAYHGSDSVDDMKEVDLGPHPEVVDGVLLVVSFIFRHSPSSLRGAQTWRLHACGRGAT